jgi:hypothetical protein
MSSFDEPGSPESSGDHVSLNVETDGTWREERIAAVLLRLLGVYFLAWAIVASIEEAVRLFFALRTNDISLDDFLRMRGWYLAYLAAEFAVGIYLLIGGRWVFEKVLIPIVPGSSKDEDADVHEKEDEDLTGTDVPPSMEPT